MSPKVEISLDEIVDFMWEYLEMDNVKSEIRKLKSFDWNPFNEDGDEYAGAFAEMAHNWELIWNVMKQFVNVAERIVVGGVGLTNQQKHKAVVEAIDRAIRLPFFLEPFDGIVIDMFVTAAVKFWNTVGWGVDATPLEVKNA